MKYNKVPDMLSGKDLDYLQDMFNWNYGAYKNTEDARNNVTDQNLQKILEKASKTFNDAMQNILQILEGGTNENPKSEN